MKAGGGDLPEKTRQEILGETIKVLTDPVLGEVFGPGSLAEVPITANLGHNKILSGQIDRLVVLPDKILIVDFKTNRPSPKTLADIPPAYIRQMKLYKDAVSAIYEGKRVVCGLLWTDTARLVVLESLT